MRTILILAMILACIGAAFVFGRSSVAPTTLPPAEVHALHQVAAEHIAHTEAEQRAEDRADAEHFADVCCDINKPLTDKSAFDALSVNGKSWFKGRFLHNECVFVMGFQDEWNHDGQPLAVSLYEILPQLENARITLPAQWRKRWAPDVFPQRLCNEDEVKTIMVRENARLDEMIARTKPYIARYNILRVWCGLPVEATSHN